MSKETKTIILKHQFSDDELIEIGEKISEKVKERTELEIEKKETNDRFTKEIKQKWSGIVKLAKKLRDGFEEVPVLCEIEYHKPEPGEKSITRTDTNEQWSEGMTEEEFNLFNQRIDEEE